MNYAERRLTMFDLGDDFVAYVDYDLHCLVKVNPVDSDVIYVAYK